MIKKLARIELEVSTPEMCPHPRVFKDYTTHEITKILCLYPYVRTCIPSSVDLGRDVSCKWFDGDDSKCPLEDVS